MIVTNKRILVLVVCTLFFQSLLSQSPCLPEGISITSQQQIDSFPLNYPNCSEIEGTVIIEGEDITSLEGLSQIEKIVEELKIFNSHQLTNLNGLNNLKYLGHFQIFHNNNLVNLDGLDSLLTIGGFLAIVGNPDLANIDALDNLTFIGHAARISENPSLTHISMNSLLSNGTNGTAGPYFEIAHNGNLINLDGLNNLRVAHNLYIVFNPSLKEISGLMNLDTIHDALDISANDSLLIVSGINKLKAIIDGPPEVALNFRLNPNLMSIEGLDSLNLIEGGCTIEKNYSLLSLEGLGKLQKITDLLDINHNTSLKNFSELESLQSVKEIHIGGNDSITDIYGLSNVSADTLEFLKIMGNLKLSDCAVESFCDYLTEYDGISWISNNGLGCNSADEIIEGCGSDRVDNPLGSLKLSIYPNPTRKGSVTIKLDHFESNLTVKIYNTHCQQVYLQKVTSQKTQVDLNLLRPGLYLIVVEENERPISKSKFTLI